MEMNPSQQEAINFINGPALCVAGPGSGKTSVLTHRIAHLIDFGISPETILVITFTNAAALEMSQRFYLLCPNHPPVTFGTFHSVFFSILKQELHLKNDCILSGNKKIHLLKEVCTRLKLDDTQDDFYDVLSRELSYITNSMCDINTYQSQNFPDGEIANIYNNYQTTKTTYGVLDFDDMLSSTYNLLSTNPTILNRWQNKFRYFLIDEVQDMNELQFKTIRLLSSHTNNIFCVGDDDQSIYAFRGANPSIMLNFDKYYPNCKNILLNYNYRSPSLIVNKAINLISHNKNRFSKDIYTTKESGLINLISCEDETSQATKLIENIQKSITDNLTSYNEIAVLFRNKNDALLIVNELVSKGIPFFIKDSMPNIYTHWIIEDILSYLIVAQSSNKIHKAHLLRILNRPNRFISRNCISSNDNYITFDSIIAYYTSKPFMQEKIISLRKNISLLSKMKPIAAINYIRKGMGYDEYLKEKAYETHTEIRDYTEIADMLLTTVHNCKNIREAVTLVFDLRKEIDYKNSQEKLSKDAGIGLFTLHSSKGLEYKEVHIINVNEGTIPSKKAKTQESIEEERRMFYVGITRAKENLYLYYTNKKRTDKTYPSRFISELDLNEISPQA